jgi:hypothetical protein
MAYGWSKRIDLENVFFQINIWNSLEYKHFFECTIVLYIYTIFL